MMGEGSFLKQIPPSTYTSEYHNGYLKGHPSSNPPASTTPCSLKIHSQNFDSVCATAPLKIFKGFPFAHRIKLKPLSLAFKTLYNLVCYIWHSPHLKTWILLCCFAYFCAHFWHLGFHPVRNVFLPLV